MMNRGCILLLIVFCISCSKNNSSPNLTPTFSFTALGNNIQWDGDGTSGSGGGQIEKGGTTGLNNNFEYFLVADDYSHKNVTMLKFNAPRIAIGTYTLTTTVTDNASSPAHLFNLNSSSWGSTHAGDFATVTITKIHDGWLADGTFSASMSCMAGSTCISRLVITNGEFHNIKYFPL